jgi:hypothetical protein
MMYEKWNDRSPKPSAFESEIHPSHKPAVCTLGISPLRGACITACKAAAAVIQRKLLPQFSLAAPLSNAVGTAAAGKPVAK